MSEAGVPLVGWYVDQVKEEGLATAQHSDESGTNGLARAEPREDTCNMADLMLLGGRPAASTPRAVCGREAMTAHTGAAKLLLQAAEEPRLVP